MKILVAEDDPLSRRLLEATMSRWGYAVVTAHDGEQAWSILQKDNAPQLVVMDWMMPGMDGIEVCRRVRAIPNPRLVYIILLTTRDLKEDTVAGLQAGADDYVTKPFDRDELRARIQVGARVIELQEILADQVRKLEAEQLVTRHFQALAMERERFDAAVSAMSDGILVTDSTYRITAANRSACLLLNLPPRGWAGQWLQAALDPFTLSVPMASIVSASDRFTAFEISRPNTRPPLYVDARLTRLLDPDAEVVSAVIALRDITAERHVQVVQADFFTLVSHKLRTPLTILGGYLALCSQIPIDKMAGQLGRILDVCSKETRRLSDLVERLLEFKSLSAQDLDAEAQRTDVGRRAGLVIAEIQSRYEGRRLDLRVEIEDDAQSVAASGGHLALVLDKLLDNAVKFNDKETAAISLEVTRNLPGWIRFSVRDNGPGIPHEYHDRIFSGFIQVENLVTGQVPGLGVGLRMARQMVQAYGGEIGVESEMGVRTTVWFTLPASPG